MSRARVAHPAYKWVEKDCLTWCASKEQAREQARIIVRTLFDAGMIRAPWRVQGGIVGYDHFEGREPMLDEPSLVPAP